MCWWGVSPLFCVVVVCVLVGMLVHCFVVVVCVLVVIVLCCSCWWGSLFCVVVVCVLVGC